MHLSIDPSYHGILCLVRWHIYYTILGSTLKVFNKETYKQEQVGSKLYISPRPDVVLSTCKENPYFFFYKVNILFIVELYDLLEC